MATATVCLTCVECGCEHTNETHQGPTWGGTPENRRYVRCQSCNTYRSRLDAALNRDASYKDESKDWSSERKAAFRERNKGKLSDDIAASLSVIVEEGWEAYQTDEFGMDGNFLDKEDMNLKHKDKPDQLASIYKNARTITCPTRGVQLWEDPQWSSSAKNGSRTRQGVKRVITQNQDNFQKKPKAEKKGQAY